MATQSSDCRKQTGSPHPIAAAICEALAPKPDLSLSEWAEGERVIARENAARPGRWRNDVTPFGVGIMDAFTTPGVREITVMGASQVIKTEVLINAALYFAVHDPAPIGIVFPSDIAAEEFGEYRLEPNILATPSAAAVFGRDGRRGIGRRDSSATKRTKQFKGGVVRLLGANVPSNLASWPHRVMLYDEVDRFPASTKKEGDPIALGDKRTESFWNSISARFSSPTIKGASKIAQLYRAGDQRRFHVPCGHCDHAEPLTWANVKWPEGRPEAAEYCCPACGVLWSEGERIAFIRRGSWVAEQPFSGHASFHISALYSTVFRLGKLATTFAKANRKAKEEQDFEALKAFVNTALAEEWDAAKVNKRMRPDVLISRCEPFSAAPDLPEDVVLITAGADTQDDRVELEIVGWGPDDQSWSLDYLRLYGDPSSRLFWEQDIAEAIGRRYRHPCGQELPIEVVCIDSQGHHTTQVYGFTEPRFDARVYAIRGMGNTATRSYPLWPSAPSTNTKGGCRVWSLGVDEGKALTYRRLLVSEPNAPAYCHFPEGREAAWFDGLLSEHLVTKFAAGRERLTWQKVSERARNEPLDCRVYATAARAAVQFDLHRRRAVFEQLMRGERIEAGPVRPAYRGRRIRHAGVTV